MADLSGWDIIAEERIRAAQAEGKFKNLPGYGKPIPGIDWPDPNWWIRGKLKAEKLSFLPPPLEAKLAREKVLESLNALSTETAVRERLSRLNDQIRRASLSALPGPPILLEPVDVECAVAEWHRAREAA